MIPRHFITKFSTFIQCLLASLYKAWNLIMSNNGVIVHVLIGIPDDFRIWRRHLVNAYEGKAGMV